MRRRAETEARNARLAPAIEGGAELLAARRRIAELERMLRPGVSDILNRLMAADFVSVSPTTGNIVLTHEGEQVIRSRTRMPPVDTVSSDTK